jgi:beta-galactosidase
LKYLFFLFILFAAGLANAQRVLLPLNEDWQFTSDSSVVNAAVNEQAGWQPVTLPHTWNVDDVMDDVPGYYRGAGWYRKRLLLDKTLHGKEIYLFFEGAGQEASVFVNGKKAGEHTGGYTAFTICITPLIDWDRENELLVKVDNSYNRNTPPLSADFTFYGGLYRQAGLAAVDPVHFSCNDNGSNAIFVSTPSVNNRNAVVTITGTVSNAKAEAKRIRISTVIYDANGKKIAEASGSMLSAAGRNKNFRQVIKKISHPRLWSPDDPYLYKVITRVVDEDTGSILDEITNPLGFRWFRFDATKGFFLNGKPCKLIGTSRHQDYKGMGNAVPGELAKKDVEWLKKMGGNFLRVAHYPQDPVVLRTCDSLGILASVEIPVVNEITESDSFYTNCRNMQVEMIRQNYNHPSVIAWCYMNEVLLRPHYNNDKEKQKTYYAAITRLAGTLDSLTRKEDPYRYTMMAHHGDYNRYRDLGLLDIPMIVGWNLYSGWYGAALNDFPAFLDAFHKNYPGKPMVVSEYGADADPRIRSMEPVRFDKSVEYTTRFHRYYLVEMLKRPFVAAAMVWNLADFNSETRTESMPHINNKGLLTWDRVPKDPYYYYQAMLSKTSFVKILGTQPAGGMADSNAAFCLRPLQAVANTPELELFINGKSAGRQQVENGLCEWRVPFINGANSIEVRGEKEGKLYSDRAVIPFCLQPYRLDNDSIPFRQMDILLGANRYFTDEEQQVWIPDQEYREGSWGHIGGKAFKLHGNGRIPYGTDKNIAGTDDDPVYQTQQMGIEKYRLDLPPGEYELTLHFAELLGGRVKEQPYNLADADRIEPNGKRIFDVYVNGKLLLGNFNITAAYGAATAVTKTTKLNIADDKGIEIYFKAIEGEPVLNALQVKRIDNGRLQVSGINP